MFCPQCHKKYARGADVCPDCNVGLVENGFDGARHPDEPLVKVFETNDPGLIAFARSLLDAARFEYMVRGEELRNLGIPAFGQIEFWVLEAHAERALTVLEPLREPAASPLADPAGSEGDV